MERFLASKWYVESTTPSEGYFAALTNDLRKEIWRHIDTDSAFAAAVCVNRRWKSELEREWYSFAERRGCFKDRAYWEIKRPWKWVVLCKTNIYTADCVKRLPGALEEASGRYEGEFEDGAKCGLGMKVFADKSFYFGLWKENMKDGEGTYIWADGTYYIGTWRADKYHGVGKKKWSDGDIYEGGWRDDKKHGDGSYTWANRDCYTGQWEEDQQHGQGVFGWSTGVQYVGNFRRNLRNDDWASLTWPNGDKYEGGFKDNVLEGKGRYCHASGDLYDGMWKASQRHGKASYRYSYGGTFEGYFKDDERNGSGAFTWPNGDRYEGVWRDGGRQGQGLFLCSITRTKHTQTWTEQPHSNYAENIPPKWPNTPARSVRADPDDEMGGSAADPMTN
jgi:hypothetical protein